MDQRTNAVVSIVLEHMMLIKRSNGKILYAELSKNALKCAMIFIEAIAIDDIALLGAILIITIKTMCSTIRRVEKEPEYG